MNIEREAANATVLLLSRIFPRWRGDAQDPALPAPPRRPQGPVPAMAFRSRVLEMA